MLHKLQKIVMYGMLLGILVALISCIAQYFICGQLWVDEAMLTLSVLNRDAVHLISAPLEWGQSAPIGYLYAVKLCTFCFGPGEHALRLFSFISWLGVCAVLWKTAKVIFKCTNIEALFVLLIFMTSDFFMRYSHEVKPYMNDNFWILSIFFSFWLYWNKSIKPWQFASICSVAFIFSFSSVFAIASCYFIVLLREVILFKQGKNHAKSFLKEVIAMIPLMVIGIAIIAYWVLPATSNAGGKNYWPLWRFPLFPTSAYEWDSFLIMMKRIATPIGVPPFILFALLSLYGIYTSIRYKSPNLFLIAAMAIAILFTLFASNRGYYPIEDRLIQYIPLLLIVIATYSYKELTNNFKNKSTAWIFLYPLIGIIIFVTTYEAEYKKMRRSIRHAVKCATGKSGENALDAYARLLSNDENVNGIYIGQSAMPQYLWLQKCYYHNAKKMPVFRPWESNIRKGRALRATEHSIYNPYYNGKENLQAIQEGLDWIKSQKTVYIYLNHKKPDIIPYLRDRGHLEVLCRVKGYDLRGLRGIEIYRFTWHENANAQPAVPSADKNVQN